MPAAASEVSLDGAQAARSERAALGPLMLAAHGNPELALQAAASWCQAASLAHVALPAPAILHAPGGRQDATAQAAMRRQRLAARVEWLQHPQQCESVHVHLLQSGALAAEPAVQAGLPGLQARCLSHQQCCESAH